MVFLHEELSDMAAMEFQRLYEAMHDMARHMEVRKAARRHFPFIRSISISC